MAPRVAAEKKKAAPAGEPKPAAKKRATKQVVEIPVWANALPEVTTPSENVIPVATWKGLHKNMPLNLSPEMHRVFNLCLGLSVRMHLRQILQKTDVGQVIGKEEFAL